VVAEIEVEILVAVARQALLNGLELEQKVVAKGADQAEARIAEAAEFLDERAQDGKDRRLAAALLLGEERRQRLKAAGQDLTFETELLPVGVRGEDRREQLRDDAAALVERAELDVAVE